MEVKEGNSENHTNSRNHSLASISTHPTPSKKIQKPTFEKEFQTEGMSLPELEIRMLKNVA